MLATIQPVCEQRKQTLESGNERSSLVRRVFAFDPSGDKWMEADRSDFLCTIDLRVALFLPMEPDR